MYRRTVLATLCSVGIGAGSGCSGLWETRLSDPRVTTDGAETSLVFETGQKQIASLFINHTYQSSKEREDWGYIRLLLSLWHRENTRVDHLRYRLQHSVARLGGANYFVETQGGDPTDLRFHHASERQGVIFEIPDPGSLGGGTMTFVFHIWPSDPQEEMDVVVDISANLSSGLLGGGYQLDAKQRVTVS